MHDRINLNNMTLAVLFSAMGILVPVLFHLAGLGSAFLPMYLPLAVGAYLLTGPNALMTGMFTPLLSALITGMPPLYPPIAFMMSVQLGVFCFLVSFSQHRLRMPVIVSLLIAITADRIILLAGYFFFAPFFSLNTGFASALDILRSVPGIILLFLLVPVTVPRCVSVINRYALRLYENKNDAGY